MSKNWVWKGLGRVRGKHLYPERIIYRQLWTSVKKLGKWLSWVKAVSNALGLEKLSDKIRFRGVSGKLGVRAWFNHSHNIWGRLYFLCEIDFYLCFHFVGRGSGRWGTMLCGFEIFLIFPTFLRFHVLNHSATSIC